MGWFTRNHESNSSSHWGNDQDNPVIVDAVETEEGRMQRRMREIHEEIAYDNAMRHLESQARYEARKEQNEAFWQEWNRKRSHYGQK